MSYDNCAFAILGKALGFVPYPGVRAPKKHERVLAVGGLGGPWSPNVDLIERPADTVRVVSSKCSLNQRMQA